MMQNITELTTGEIKIDNNGYHISVIKNKIRRAVTQAEIDANNIGALKWNGTDFVINQAVVDQKNVEAIVKKRIEQKALIKQSMLGERNNYATVNVTINNIVQNINATERSLLDCQALKSYMIRNSLNQADYRNSSNQVFTVTQSDLDIIKDKIEDNGLALYQKKWQLESSIDNALTEQDILSILW